MVLGYGIGIPGGGGFGIFVIVGALSIPPIGFLLAGDGETDLIVHVPAPIVFEHPSTQLAEAESLPSSVRQAALPFSFLDTQAPALVPVDTS